MAAGSLARPRGVHEALLEQHPCFGSCHETLSVAQRTRAVEIVYHCDDALRGWGYVPVYDIDGDRLWRAAQARNDPGYRGIAVRFGECIYRRLVGAMLHEVLHAVFGDPSRPNHGIPFGLPYAVPESVPERDEESYLAPFNFAEARAFAGVWVLAERVFELDWRVLNARDFATMCFPGGNALVPPPRGFRAVAHVDPEHHPERYLRRVRAVEEEALAWFTPAHLDEIVRTIEVAAAAGRSTRPRGYPSPADVARVSPRAWGRNDPCPCASGRKVKACCRDGARGEM
jgi:hypothetical protein